jgi:polyhydroxybutyrate depolymerase
MRGRFQVVSGALLLALATGCSSNPPVGGNGGLVAARPYDIDVPAGYDKSKSYPLILLLHGYGANGFLQDAVFGFNVLADTHGVLVAHPDGTRDSMGKLFWNADDACCDIDHIGVDDVAYLNAVLDDVQKSYNVDARRVFVAGHSNGAFMAHRLACDSAPRIAGIMALAGDVWKDASKCQPSSAVAVLQVHGDADDTVAYAGDARVPSAADSVATWAQKNGCSGDLTDTGQTLDIDTGLPGNETGIARYACTAGAAELWTIHGGAHLPSFKMPDWANDVFDWLMQHPKP